MVCGVQRNRGTRNVDFVQYGEIGTVSEQIYYPDRATILMTKWSVKDDDHTRELALPPLTSVLTDGERSEVSRLGRFLPGMKVRQETVDWLDKTYRIARKEWKRKCGSKDAHDKWAEERESN